MPSFSSTQSVQEPQFSDSEHGSQPIYKFETADNYMNDYHSNSRSTNQSSGPQIKFSTPSHDDMERCKSSTPTIHPALDQLSARAAELKAQLLQRRKEGRSNSDTPPVAASEITKGEQDSASSLRSQNASPASNVTNHTGKEQDLNISELISQYAKEKYAEENGSVNTKNDQQKTSHMHAQTKNMNNASAKAQASSLNSNTPTINSASTTKGNVKDIRNSNIRFGTVSNISAEETLKNSPPNQLSESISQSKTLGPQVPKEPAAMALNGLEPRLQSSHTETSYSMPTSAKYGNVKPRVFRRQQKSYADIEGNSSIYQERSNHGQEISKPETNGNQSEGYNTSTQRNPPTLEQLLPFDGDLKEWLEITGFHNVDYRDKILSRRRAIAALDAQREKLLAEMEAEERGVVPVVSGANQIRSSILPLPIVPRSSQQESSPATPVTPANQAPAVDPRTKRAYSEVQSEMEATGSKTKAARIEHRDENRQMNERTPKPNGINMSDNKFIEPSSGRRSDEGKHSYRGWYDDSHDQKHSPSHEREMSPDQRPFEGRMTPRMRKLPWDHDGNEAPGKAPFVIRGNYKGRSYDPLYHSRGRGRSISDRSPGSIERPIDHSNQYGIPLANRRPYKDLRGFDRGGRGDTRYFIVKSFNEANVANCIEDSIWTTQVQNGEIFKKAFETCKNVILVFSINKSRAFQGYARMESVPGSVPNPGWTRSIQWESTGAFKVRWLVIYSTRFHLVGHLKNSLNENQAVLVGKDGQEIEERCGDELIKIINEESDRFR
ncbi:hypothetical protein B7463_g4696, partial [Scytalidium lignicola]